MRLPLVVIFSIAILSFLYLLGFSPGQTSIPNRMIISPSQQVATQSAK